MAGFHFIDFAVVAVYIALVTYFGKRASKGVADYEGFFLAGRKMSPTYQFFLNFGQSTDANGAVSTASLVYQQGVSGVWMAFQLVFLNPYFWFMNMWFRRARLVTTADLFVERLGSLGLARFYALFQTLSLIFVVIGFGNLVTYKISAALLVKPEAVWTITERASVEGYREFKELEQRAKAGPLATEAAARLTVLREQEARGTLHSYVTMLDPLTFYIVYTLVVGCYVVMGGVAATAVNEIMQSLLIVVFSLMLIPAGFSAIGGAQALSERVPAVMFDLLAAGTGGESITGLVLLAILLAAFVQINGIPGNMGISGSAKDEYSARFGAVSGTYCKRLMIIMWAFCGLIAVAIFQGPDALSDPDTAWGSMSRRLLSPGLLGLMVTGVLAANMSTIATETLSAAALFVRYVYGGFRPKTGTTEAVAASRWTIIVLLAIGVFATIGMTSVFSVLQLVQTVNVPFGAAVLLIFFWRRLTAPAVWTAVLVSAALNIAGPHLVSRIDTVRTHPILVERSQDSGGRLLPVYFETVVRADAEDLRSPLEGHGRLHLELVLLRLVGFNVGQWTPSTRFASRFFVDVLTPFVFLIGVSLLTRPPRRDATDQFFGRLKTPVGATPELEREAVEETRRDPARFNHTKLFPKSTWEFTKWDRVDTIGFLVCCAISGGLIALFWGLLRWAAG